MASETPFPFNQLPQELQREVFISAARHIPGSALQLVRVSQKVNNWVQPFIYHMVALGHHDADLFARTIDSKLPDFFATHVKHLCLTNPVPKAKANKVLGVCSGVVELALWVDFGGKITNTTTVASLSALELRRLSIEHVHLLSFFSAPKSIAPPWYNTLTHLEVVFWTHIESPSVPGLGQLTSLTHLTLGLRHSIIHEAWVSAILSDCPSLRILIVTANENEDEVEDLFRLGDCWVVPMLYPTSVVRNWEASFFGLPDIYSRAEEEVRLKESSPTTPAPQQGPDTR